MQIHFQWKKKFDLTIISSSILILPSSCGDKSDAKIILNDKLYQNFSLQNYIDFTHSFYYVHIWL